MSELRRWLEDAPPTEVRRMLEAGRWARPSRAVFEQALRQVRNAGTVGVPDSEFPMTRRNAFRTGVKWTLFGALVVGALAVLTQTLGSGDAVRAPQEPPTQKLANLAATGAAAPSPAERPEPEEALSGRFPTQSKPASPRPATHEPARRARPAASRKTRATVSTGSSQGRVCNPAVVQQIEMLEQAKLKLGSGRGAEALAILDRYDGYGAGRCFVPESMKHRMDAYLQTGNQAAAVRTAKAIEKYYPNTAQARAAKAVLKK